MENLILFINSFFSYLLVFVIAIVVIIVAIFIGTKLRKNKDAKTAIASAADAENNEE